MYMSRSFLILALFAVLLSHAATAQILPNPPCETKAYFNPQGQDFVYQQNLPTPWWGVKMNVEWIATVDTAIISFGITKAAGSGPDTLDVRVLADTLPKFFVLDQMSLGLAPDINGNIPDAQYIVEFAFQQPLAWVDPPGDFWLSWRLRGPSSDVARIMMRTPALHPERSVVINQNGTTTLVTDYVGSAVQDSVDLWAEAHVCYPYGWPVELQNFTVSYHSGNAVLRWITASETSNYGFYIERLLADRGAVRVWQNIGFQPGHGSTSEMQQYTFMDTHPEIAMDADGVVRYRLRQVDFDGSAELSPVVELFLPQSVDGFALDQNYPNPVHAGTTATQIGFTLPETGPVKLRLHDALGREMAVIADGTFERGYHSLPFAPGLPAGVYYYTLTAGGQKLTRRMTVVE
jgi:hypothetical protein